MAELTQNSILRISDEKTYRLIELYEKERCLWDTSFPEYRSREKRAIAAERVARKLGVKHFEAKHVMIKFKNLRNSYCQELKKIAHSLNSGVNENEAYRPRVFWFSKMDSFLRPHLQPTPGNSYLYPQTDESTREDSDKEKEKDKECEGSKDKKIKAEPASGDDDEEELEEMEDSIFEKNRIPVPTAEKRKEPQAVSSDDDEPLRKRQRPPIKRTLPGPHAMHSCIEQSQSAHMLRNISMCLEAINNKRDDVYDNFGKYVASMLRAMPPSRALLLQPKIVTLLADPEDTTCRVSQSDGKP